MQQQDLAVACGYWPLFRYDPVMRSVGENPFRLDSPRPTIPFRDFAYNEIRYRALAQTRPEEAAELLAMAQDMVNEKYRTYEEMAGWSPSRFPPIRASESTEAPPAVVKEGGGHGPRNPLSRTDAQNPLVASASPLTSDLGNLRRLEDCGAAAVVLPSIFEEQIEAEEAETERLTTFRGESFPEAISYFPAAIDYSTGPQGYLEHLRRAREAIATPMIASLNGISRTGWCDYARLVEQAGKRDRAQVSVHAGGGISGDSAV
jgi:hypothetical protein